MVNKANTATTWAGVPLAEIPKAMNEPYPDSAYVAIPYGPMRGKTDIKFYHSRQRLEKVFGPQGIGWRIDAHPTLGSIIETSELRTSQAGREYEEWTVKLKGFVFKYFVTDPASGTAGFVDTSIISDAHSNEDLGYAYRGAWTSLMKQAIRALGGIDHLFGDADDTTYREPSLPKQRSAAKPASKPSNGNKPAADESQVDEFKAAWAEKGHPQAELARTFFKNLGITDMKRSPVPMETLDWYLRFAFGEVQWTEVPSEHALKLDELTSAVKAKATKE